jgi:hypothetical protein
LIRIRVHQIFADHHDAIRVEIRPAEEGISKFWKRIGEPVQIWTAEPFQPANTASTAAAEPPGLAGVNLQG